MKKESPLRSSISLLIGIVIAILALVRGRMLLPLLLAVLALWLLWWLLTQALPLWRNNRAYRAKEARLREQTAAAKDGGQLADALLCHVNYRITAMLHAAYPNARWEWLADKPSRFAVEGGTARIRVYGIPDFDYADVKLDQKANLDCSLVKLSPLVAGASDTQPPNRQPVNPRVWFETRGRAVLEALVTDLNSRGHSSLTVQENGEVFVQAKENEAEPAKETFLDFPEKVYWPQLVKVLEEEGYAADARDADKLMPEDIEPQENKKVIQECVGITCTKLSSPWTVYLSTLIAAHYCCRPYRSSVHGSKVSEIGFIGMEDDFKLCKLAFLYAYDCIASRCRQIRTQKGYPAKTLREMCNSYGWGFCRGLSAAFQKQEAEHQEWGLVMVVPQAVEDAVSKMKRSSYKISSTSSMNRQYAAMGYADGQEFDMRRRLEPSA